jgi:hypothetical protein
MKRSILSLSAFFLVAFGFTQNRHTPPGSVSESFQREYPKSQPSQWQHSNQGWSATFDDRDHNNGEAIANFDASGRHIDTHIPYDQQDVPQPVRDHMQRSYGGSDPYEVTRIDRPRGNGLYMARYKHKNKNKTIYFDQDGRERNDYKDNHHYEY